MNDLIVRVAVIGCGGALGTMLRALLLVWLDGRLCAQPYALLIVNSLGCLAMGFLVGFVCVQSLWIQFLSVGVLGGFTTFSSFAAVTAALQLTSGSIVALGYLLASPTVSLLLFWLGQYGARLI